MMRTARRAGSSLDATQMDAPPTTGCTPWTCKNITFTQLRLRAVTSTYPFFVAHPDVLVQHGDVAQNLGAEGTDGAAAVLDGVLLHEVNRTERLVTIRALHSHPAAP